MGVHVKCSYFGDAQHVETLTLEGVLINGDLSGLQEFNFTQMVSFTVGDTELCGSLPQNLTGESLKWVEFKSNRFMKGGLPDRWHQSLRFVEKLILGPSRWQGSLPVSWGTSFPALRTLKILGPSDALHHEDLGLTGPIPESWARPGSFPALTVRCMAC